MNVAYYVVVCAHPPIIKECSVSFVLDVHLLGAFSVFLGKGRKTCIVLHIHKRYTVSAKYECVPRQASHSYMIYAGLSIAQKSGLGTYHYIDLRKMSQSLPLITIPDGIFTLYS